MVNWDIRIVGRGLGTYSCSPILGGMSDTEFKTQHI